MRHKWLIMIDYSLHAVTLAEARRPNYVTAAMAEWLSLGAQVRAGTQKVPASDGSVPVQSASTLLEASGLSRAIRLGQTA